MNIDDRQPTSGPIHTFGKISNGHTSATRQPIHFMFGFRVGFSGTVDRTVPFPVGSNPRWRPAAILENFKWPYFSNILSDLLYVCTQTILCPRSLVYNDGDLKLTVFHNGASLGDLRYKEKERKGRSWEIAEKTTLEEYTLDCSQCKVFLVMPNFTRHCSRGYTF